jgi:hypothetical protein
MLPSGLKVQRTVGREYEIPRPALLRPFHEGLRDLAVLRYGYNNSKNSRRPTKYGEQIG